MALPPVHPAAGVNDGEGVDSLVQPRPEFDATPTRIVARALERDFTEQEAERLREVRLGERMYSSAADRFGEGASAKSLDVLDEDGARREPHRPTAQTLNLAGG